VVFLEDELDEPAGPITGEIAGIRERENDQLVAQLEAEASRLREQLQITVEEHESSIEEMKATNEELQSINEEYRSATEELETSKEELQSVNEELQTVNNELKTKIDEVLRAKDELQNLLGAMEIPTLFLDRELRIQRYTPSMQKLVNIMPGDRGRPISHLTHRLLYQEFVPDAEQILHNLVPVEREVRADNGDWYLARLRPYRTTKDKIDGVIITFINVTEIKQAERSLLQLSETLEEQVQQRTEQLNEANEKLSAASELFHNLFHANPIPTSLTRLADGLFLDINDAYLQFYELEREAVIGYTSQELNLPLAPDQRPGIVAQLKKEGMIRNLELEVAHPSGETRTILASIQHIHLVDDDALILTFNDITARVLMERQVRDVASNLTSSEQAERYRIARILHDDLQQNIFAVKMQLSFLQEALESNNVQALNTDLEQLDEWLAKAIATTRQLSIDLSPPVLHGEGLTEGCIWLAAQMKEQYGLEVSVHPNGVRAILEDDIRTLIFQTVRELLFNVVKHAETLKATLIFEQMDGHVRVIVSDDGKGFDTKVVMEDWKNAHGLLRMRDRLFLLGCSLQADSEPGNGTRIIIEAPIKPLTN